MEKANLRLVSVIGGAIVVLGILVIAGQYLAGLSSRASANVADDVAALKGDTVTLNKADFVELLKFPESYAGLSDSATRWELVQDLDERLSEIARDLIASE